MARSRKPSDADKTETDTPESKVEEASEGSVEDAVVIEETDDATTSGDSKEVEAEGPTSGTEPEARTEEESVTEAEAVEGQAEQAETPPEEPAAPEPQTQPEPQPTPVDQKSGAGGAIALVFGGVVAALVGFAAARFIFPDGWPGQGAELDGVVTELRAEIAAQDSQIAALEAEITNLRTELSGMGDIDLSGIEGDVGAVMDETEALGASVDTLSSRLTELSEAVAAIEQRPVPEALDTSALDAELAEFRAELSAAVDEARAGIVAAEEEAARIAAEAAAAAAEREAAAAAAAAQAEADAREAAERARREAALVSIMAALDSGESYAEPLGELEGADVPEGLAAPAPDGVPTLNELRETFPDAARAALDASIRGEVDGSATDRFMAFLRVQSGARSLEPREGSDPDAVLSRAEAALREGDLAASLAELDQLPEPGQAAIAGWRAEAETRLAAMTGARALAETLNAN